MSHPPNNWRPKHDATEALLLEITIELKLARAAKAGKDWGRPPADLATDAIIAQLEAAYEDIRRCKEPRVLYRRSERGSTSAPPMRECPQCYCLAVAGTGVCGVCAYEQEGKRT